MASWVTHLMIADKVLSTIKSLKRKEFRVGNIAPDCNVENEDWTQFTPSREITHWMSSDKKVAADCERFFDEYIKKRADKIRSDEEFSFLLGYYSHLVADAEFTRSIRDEERVAASWERIKNNEELAKRAQGMPETFDYVKKLINKDERMAEIYAIEAEYLESNRNSGYLTEILPLKEFPDYIDYLPHGAIVRKIGVMGYLPEKPEKEIEFICFSKDEYDKFINRAAKTIIEKIKNEGSR